MAIRTQLNALYHGASDRGRRFRYALLTFDIVTVTFFILSSMVSLERWVIMADYAIASVLALDFLAQLWIARKPWRHLFRPLILADLVVILSLMAPLFLENLAFLRVVRMLRLLRSYHVLRELRDNIAFFRQYEDTIQSALNLFVFIFFVTALVFVMQVRDNPQINNYIDALYFTVTTLTTTGFGDITLEGSHGRLLAVIIMVVGVALFLRLVQTIFRPQKVQYKCPDCGLTRHDPDAIHCKHCGRVLNIETDGDWE
ncbi:potassium channel family protein [Magnetospira sp. QH-2]|uniref:potassium channel family protein n=1 Tax=Magnetospira sp. (strain QH-2) TaxID=1288970 RepID=UPI0005FA8DE8|nr:potassium channel family protein [Magnetospira sp. QH-2]